MKRILVSIALIVVLMVSLFALTGCDSGAVVTEGGANSTGSMANTGKKYGLNEEITIKNNSGDNYTVVITGITETSERNEFSDKNPAQVFIIDYTYKCVGTNDSVYVSDMNFKIIDQEGEIGETYPNSYTYPKEITEGITCKAQMCLCVNNRSNKITLQFFDNMWNTRPDATFELDV